MRTTPRLPPLNALRAFESVARHLSVKEAASELNVTGGAISLQIRNLEEALGQPLFHRRARQMALTEAGQRYFLSVSAAFRVLKDATAALQVGRASVITVSCTQGFAMQWLMPRLAEFSVRWPGIDVRISTTHRLVDFAADGIDFAVRHGLGRYAGLQSEKLLDDPLVPVASPVLLAQKPALRVADDLRYFALLHDEQREDWRMWLAASGAKQVDGSRGLLFSGNAVVEAATAGRGVALLRESLIAAELERRQLKKVFARTLKVDIAYHLVYPLSVLERKEAEQFREWIIEEARGG